MSMTFERAFACTPTVVVRTPLLPITALHTLDRLVEEVLSTDWNGQPPERVHIIRLGLSLATSSSDLLLSVREPSGTRQAEARAIDAVFRYLCRAASRATPFGIFAGCASATIGARTELVRAPDALHTIAAEPSYEWLDRVRTRALAEAQSLDHLRLRTSATAIQWQRFVRFTTFARSARDIRHTITEADALPEVIELLARARDGASFAELRTLLMTRGDDYDSATALIREMLESQLLDTELTSPLTASDPLGQFKAGITALGEPELDELLDTHEKLLTSVHGSTLAAAAAEQIVTRVAAEHENMCVVMRPRFERATVSDSVPRETLRALEFLGRCSPPNEALTMLIEPFHRLVRERYEDEPVPLLELLDPDLGVGFAPEALAARVQGANALPRWASASAFKEALGEGLMRSDVIQSGVFAVDDLASLLPARDYSSQAMPDAFSVTVDVASEASRAGEPIVNVMGAMGPGIGPFVSRFARVDEQLLTLLQQVCAAEEALSPGMAFAEVLYLGSLHDGNVSRRPKTYSYEIALDHAAATPGVQSLLPADLHVSAGGARVRLLSLSLGCEVLPRFSTAHNYRRRSLLPTYQFLGALYHAYTAIPHPWSWGEFTALPRLPRLTLGRAILCKAMWRVTREWRNRILSAGDSALQGVVAEWCHRSGVPQHVTCGDGDQVLSLDLRTVGACRALRRFVSRTADARVTEQWPTPEACAVTGEAGRYSCEVVLPFARKDDPRKSAPGDGGARRAVMRRQQVAVPEDKRRVLPGNGWLFGKLYLSAAHADMVLINEIHVLSRHARDRGFIDRWFFVRYDDDGWHLRVRWHGERRELLAQVLPRFMDVTDELLRMKVVRRVCVDTYHREIERYGGADGLAIAEEAFAFDSEFVLRVLARYLGRETEHERWILAAMSADRLLRTFAPSYRERQQIVRTCAGYAADGTVAAGDARGTWKQVYRGVRTLLLQAIETSAEVVDLAFTETERALKRSWPNGARLLPVTAQASLLHMHLNRALREDHFALEGLICFCLESTYESAARRQA